MNSQPTLLIVDDGAQALAGLAAILADEFDLKAATGVAAAEQVLAEEWVQILLFNQCLLKQIGSGFLEQVQRRWPDIILIIVSDRTEPDAISGLLERVNIAHYLTQPWYPESLILTLKNALRLFELQRENELLTIELKMAPQQWEQKLAQQRRGLRSEFQESDGLVRSVGSPLEEVCERIKTIAMYDISVLIHGESGTGKELAARALHYNSPRWDKPFVVENCAALPDELLESELFGYKKGAFTGALEDRVGLFERASGGTIFLDEIGEVSPAFQVRLLRVLQEGEIRRLGGGSTRKVDLRVIAATNKDLEEEVRCGRFREDLYYRLATTTITMPPLRERRSDIPVLARALLEQAVGRLGKPAQGFTDEAVACMQRYAWPGNVRELQNEVQQMLILGGQAHLGAELLSPRVLRTVSEEEETWDEDVACCSGGDGSLKQRVESLEVRILRETLIRNRWNKSRAARELGLSRVGLSSKLERYGLEKEGMVAGSGVSG